MSLKYLHRWSLNHVPILVPITLLIQLFFLINFSPFKILELSKDNAADEAFSKAQQKNSDYSKQRDITENLYL